jgi:hypothetical protein
LVLVVVSVLTEIAVVFHLFRPFPVVVAVVLTAPAVAAVQEAVVDLVATQAAQALLDKVLQVVQDMQLTQHTALAEAVELLQ